MYKSITPTDESGVYLLEVFSEIKVGVYVRKKVRYIKEKQFNKDIEHIVNKAISKVYKNGKEEQWTTDHEQC